MLSIINFHCVATFVELLINETQINMKSECSLFVFIQQEKSSNP